MAKIPTDIPPQITTGSPASSQTTASSTSATSAVSVTTQNSTTSPPQTSSSIQISTTTVIPQLAKEVSIGDIINFSVRGRTPEGLGILYFMGQLVNAKIPEHLKTGDRVQAQISYENQQVLFKILSVLGNEKTQTASDSSLLEKQPANFASLTISIQNKVEEMLFTISKFLPDSKNVIPENLPNQSTPISSLTANESLIKGPLKELLEKLQSILPNQDEMTNGLTLLPKLQAIFTTGTNETLKAITKELKQFLDTKTPNPEQRFTISLLDQLQTLHTKVESGAISNEIFRSSLDRIIKAMEQEISKDIKFNLQGSPKESHSTTLKVGIALLKEATLPGEPKADTIRKAIDYITTNNMNAFSPASETEAQLPPRMLNEIKTMITALEQFTYTQEMMLRMEPILQAMKQPELLLFPFLFQGFFSFGELLVDPDSNNSNFKKQKNEDGDGDENSSENPNMQYQAMLPLPHLGIVRFNTIHSNNEMDLNLIFEDKEKSLFVEERVSDLRQELTKLGFNTLHISAQENSATILENITTNRDLRTNETENNSKEAEIEVI